MRKNTKAVGKGMKLGREVERKKGRRSVGKSRKQADKMYSIEEEDKRSWIRQGPGRQAVKKKVRKEDIERARNEAHKARETEKQKGREASY